MFLCWRGVFPTLCLLFFSFCDGAMDLSEFLFYRAISSEIRGPSSVLIVFVAPCVCGAWLRGALWVSFDRGWFEQHGVQGFGCVPDHVGCSFYWR